FTDAATGQRSLAPCYIGDDTLVQSLWRTLCADQLQAVIEFGAPQVAAGRTRRQWALDLRETIAALRA
ncbi:MAG: 1-acyl-sn-glycerol-3-phosphate acyltransferase, partial [Candidatus Saccharibacteria bacterium]|nr:1-acyl-sn-glycerol-3-phosphate acyltransferase [Rhodoferax sp.]